MNKIVIPQEETKLAAIDLGYSWVKGQLECMEAWRIPAVVGEPRDVYDQDITRTDLRYYADLTTVPSYFVGDLALRHSDIKYTSTGKDKAKAFHTKILLEACLGSLARYGTFNLVTGLPLDFYNTQKADMEALLNDFSEGSFFSLQHGKRSVEDCTPSIAKYKIVPQHMGAFMNHILDSKGQEKQAGDILKTWLVVDPGSHTLGLMGMERGQIMKESSSPVLGVEVAYKVIQDELKRQLGRTPDRFALDRYVLQGDYDGINLTELRDYAFKKWASQIQLEVDSFNRDFHGYILTGGWAKELIKYLVFPAGSTVVVMDQLGNLEGYIKIGRRAWPAAQ